MTTHFFCALFAEAAPLIQHFKLSALKQYDLYRLYQTQDKQMSLTITGIGKLNMAAAIAYHHACLQTTDRDIWFNIGIAGCANYPLGESFLIHKIIDQQTQDCWYPQILFKPHCATAALITLPSPSTDYQTALFDMEAAAFYQMAIRLGTHELIHSFKIVSDNLANPAQTINTDRVKTLIAAKIELIEQTLAALKPLVQILSSSQLEPAHYQTILSKWHFTHSQRIQLARLLRQWEIRLTSEDVVQFVTLMKNSRTVIQSLQNKLTETAFQFND